MKRISAILAVLFLIFALVGCAQTPSASGGGEENANSQTNTGDDKSNTAETDGGSQEDSADSADTSSGAIVVYFSCTGNTKAVAEKLAELSGADLYEIVPAEPYTSDDIDYSNDSCRANTEMNDEDSRPAIGSEEIDLSDYDTVLIGYPMWWGTMPRIIDTFLDAYDLSGKTVIPFCTSGGSGVSKSVSDIKAFEPDADVRDGIRAGGANDNKLGEWLTDNGIELK